MAKFIPVQYSKRVYPEKIVPKLTEVAGHFDAHPISLTTPFSLHTEYCFAPRKFNSDLIKPFNILAESHKHGIPMLWRSVEWAEQFADFVVAICSGKEPTVVEIHPPFSDYTDLSGFFNCYSVFEKKLTQAFPYVCLLVENRSGTYYRGGHFIISTANQIKELSSLLEQSDCRLSITLDIPQLFTAHKISNSKCCEMQQLLEEMRLIRNKIGGIHLWGKRDKETGRRSAHEGDLNSYFRGNMETKDLFLKSLLRLLDDEIPRYFVPEVNSSNDDFLSIIHDLLSSGVEFV